MSDPQDKVPAPNSVPQRMVKSARKSAVKSAASGARIDARPRDQELNERPISRNQARPNAAQQIASHEPQQQTDKKRVTFDLADDLADFPLPIERRPVARTRVAQNSGRLNPGFAPSGAREGRGSFPSESASFFPGRSSRAGSGRQSMADVPRRGRGRQSTNDAQYQHRAAKSQQLRLHTHTEPLAGKYARKFEGRSIRTSSSVPRMSSANRDISQDHLVDSSSEHSDGSLNYVDIGLTLSKLRRDESSDNNSVEFVGEASVQVKAARKFQFGRKSKKDPPDTRRSVTPQSSQSSEQSDDEGSAVPAAAREDSEELEYVDLGIPPHNITREQTDSSSESDAAKGDEAPTELPSDTLIEALEYISLTTIRLARLHRLPFMVRNLRKGFLSRCKSLGIDTSHSVPPLRPITVVYSCVAEDRSLERQETRTTMQSWKCPLCELHGTFPLQQILNAHLNSDHSEVGFAWDMNDYTLSIRLPLPGYLPLPRHRQLPGHHQLPGHVPLSPHWRPLMTPSTRTASTEVTDFSSNNINSSKYTTPATTLSPSRNPSVSSQHFPDADSLDVKPKYYIPMLRTGSEGFSNTRSSSISSRMLSRASSLRASGNPTPPPRSDPLGPAAQPPYLPKDQYSCRLGGPRVYDLLNTMSLDKFGVLAWVILDREEEIFEIDDVRDEDKVMQALWLRWIFLNRNKFVANFFEGTRSFIKDNWRMIHLAAGLAALRTWLLVLNINNFLVTPDVVTLLRDYRGLTNKQQWHDSGNAVQNEVAPV
ncbi:uncharacterized protein EDB91DRAFT_1130770 [Suillus paluster]|uniref:uncharacterized protein n=1 Tax=Suillus paluster TaxID=48578 RepID=UPI001B885B2D|nr:uncharacterized protein EDB91DRAFT_1130770 [Suillus paluster]KAG1741498.1 hypothetical protein EDB91DRAFT_1130770 [Suillus paluster]